MHLPLKTVEAKEKRERRGNSKIFSLQYANLAGKKPQHNTSLEARFLKCNCKIPNAMSRLFSKSPPAPDNQRGSRAGSKQQEASLFTDPNASSPVLISHHSAFSFTLFALAQSSSSSDSAENNMDFHPCLPLPMTQLLTGMVLSNCPAKSSHTYN